MNSARVVAATLIAGTLDIASAILLTLARGKPVAPMLEWIATGPFGDGLRGFGLAPAIGLLVHYGIMAVMVVIFALAADRVPQLLRRPLVFGAVYGVLLYGVMYWIVMPLRWGPTGAALDASRIAIPVAIHIVLVGWPIALILAGGTARSRTG